MTRALVSSSIALALSACGCSTTTTVDTGSAGDSWTNRTQGTNGANQLWTAVASNTSGDAVVATARFVVPPAVDPAGGIWTSTNAGESWGVAMPDGDWASIASDATGTKLVAVGPGIWTSSDGGATWISRAPSDPLADLNWSSVTSDSSGTYLAAAAFVGGIWTSSDSGATWIDHSPNGLDSAAWAAVSSDSTGARLIALQTEDGYGGDNGQGDDDVWTSTDGGDTWIHRMQFAGGNANCSAVASDATATQLVVADGGLWISADAGVTWARKDPPAADAAWSYVASDSTGAQLAAVGTVCGSSPGDIWTSVDAGASWTNATAGTAASGLQWRAVASNASGDLLVGVVDAGDIWTM